MTFIVGDTNRKPGGSYNDTLHISIEPNLAQHSTAQHSTAQHSTATIMGISTKTTRIKKHL
ncbi:hypothetical protein G6Z94_11255 [Vibrio aestuarianus]|nr:hypothetical protein [Vibrio aestuarianus]